MSEVIGIALLKEEFLELAALNTGLSVVNYYLQQPGRLGVARLVASADRPAVPAHRKASEHLNQKYIFVAHFRNSFITRTVFVSQQMLFLL